MTSAKILNRQYALRKNKENKMAKKPSPNIINEIVERLNNIESRLDYVEAKLSSNDSLILNLNTRVSYIESILFPSSS